MRSKYVMASLLACALGLSGCATSGRAPPTCPVLPPIPASLMQPSNAESKVRAILFDSPPSGTPKSTPSKP